MQIGVSAWRLYGQPLGVVRYIEYLLLHWREMLGSDRATLFVHEPVGEHLRALAPAIESRLVQPRMTNALWENLLLPRAARGVDVLFGPSYTLPLTSRLPAVVSIHSVDEAEPGAHSLWHRMTYSQKYRLSARRARRVVANSESTKARLCERYGVPADRVDAIWLGADAMFRPLDDDQALVETRRRYFGGNRPYILFVGGLSKRRNVPLLIEAFARLKTGHGIPHGLLLVGPNRSGVPLDALIAQYGVSGDVVQTDGRFTHHSELVPIYNAADLYVMPSSSEGFSLTLAEAMSCGTPVVTVNRASLGEVAHGYGFTIESPELEALADAIHQVISSESLRAALRERSLERAKLLRWDLTARRTLDVLRRVVSEA